MAINQCPTCGMVVHGQENCPAACSNCGTVVRIPYGFQAPLRHIRRRCDDCRTVIRQIGQSLDFSCDCSEKVHHFHFGT